MKNTYKMFLLAVEEMNFTKAAERAFVTQQCLSSNIKRLEEDTHTQLFERAPKLKLTAAGKALYETVRQMELIEYNLDNQLKEIKDGTVGKLTFGINATRARIFLPSLFDQYQKLYPKVEVAVLLGDTEDFMQLLLEKKLDLFLGVSCRPEKLFEFLPINEEPMYLIATNSFLHKCYTGSSQWQELRNGQTIDIHDFSHMPITGNRGISTASQLVHRFLDAQHIIPTKHFFVSDYDTQISMCGRNLTATFCSMFVVDRIIDYNKFRHDREPLLILKVKGMNETLQVDIVKPKQLYVPAYMEAFIQLVIKQVKNYGEKINAYTFNK